MKSSIKAVSLPQKKCYILAKDSASGARRLVEKGEVHGAVGIGGSTGSQVATDVMRAIPYSVTHLSELAQA